MCSKKQEKSSPTQRHFKKQSVMKRNTFKILKKLWYKQPIKNWQPFSVEDVTGDVTFQSSNWVSGISFALRFTPSTKMDDFEEHEIWHLHRKGSWEEILEKFGRNKFLPWFWPDRDNLEFIESSVRKQKSENVVSVGCGSGLFEWLLKMATGLEVIGIEIDRTWWKSKYSSGTFIPLRIVEDSARGEFEFETGHCVLLFCYFNNGEAFSRYLSNFKGNCFIVIGPGPGRGTYTIPEPFRLPEGTDEKWELSDQQEVRSAKDFIAVYVRKGRQTQET